MMFSPPTQSNNRKNYCVRHVLFHPFSAFPINPKGEKTDEGYFFFRFLAKQFNDIEYLAFENPGWIITEGEKEYFIDML